MDGLEFENGQLVKWHGQRPEYMDGHSLLGLIRLLGKRVHDMNKEQECAAYRLDEIDGCLSEYENMPCKSLRARLREAVERAKKEM